jgi:two-component system OmpR family response regulator
MRLLLVEDDQYLGTLIKQDLIKSGFTVDLVNEGKSGEFMGSTENYDIVVLDLGLPILSGLEVLKIWRKNGLDMPVLVLTARDNWYDRVDGFDAGADDYLGKPFHIEELLARINAIIKRSKGHSPRRIDVLGLSLDEDNKTVRQNNVLHNLTPIEYMLLRLFLLNPNKLLTKSRLLESLYEVDSDPDSNVLEVYISRLRQKIGKHRIITRRNQGYLFKDDT